MIEIGDNITLHHGDCRDVLRALPENSIDAIVTDPPYFEVKGEAWDHQWDTSEGYLSWLGSILDQLRRVLRANGSLYMFATPQMAARVELEIGKRFNVLNHITWRKGRDGATEMSIGVRNRKENQRAFFPSSERIIFAEHYGADGYARGEGPVDSTGDKGRAFIFEPLREYLVGEMKRAGFWTADGKRAANVACGFSPSLGGMAARHYFSRSQWQLPTAKHYAALRELLNGAGDGKYLRKEYEELRKEYEELRKEYEELRRPFNITARDQWSDVWDFDPVLYYEGKHPCEKPQALLSHILRASVKPGGVVLDPFMGCGSLGVACVARELGFIGIEQDAEYFATAQRRIDHESRQLRMF